MRLFIATRLEDPAAGRLERGLAGVRARASRASWVSPHAYHLTYAFPGDQEQEVATTIGDALVRSLSGVPRYHGAISEAGFFPDERRPRVGWLAFEEPAPLTTVAVAVRQMLDLHRVNYDRKPFTPHLTVVRIRDPWTSDDMQMFGNACRAMGRTEVVVDRVSLFRSELRPAGAIHHELAVAVLG